MSATDPLPVPDAPRPRQLSERQAASIDALLTAGLEVVREVGYHHMSLRTVAARAGMTHTTAYTYFSSKAHLVTEIFWDQLRRLPVEPSDPSQPLSVRLTDALRGPGLLMADEHALAQAGLVAMLGDEPDVRRLRDTVGADLLQRIVVAFGDDARDDDVEAIALTFNGAMLMAGMGYFGFDGVVERVGRVARLVEERRGQEAP